MIGLTLFVGVVIANYSENKVSSQYVFYAWHVKPVNLIFIIFLNPTVIQFLHDNSCQFQLKKIYLTFCSQEKQILLLVD
jgi:hypothetical protein